MTTEKTNEYGNSLFKFGNWTVTDQGIYWSLEKPKYFIDKSKLSASRPNGHGYKYDEMLNIAQKDWLTKTDLENFNHAFLFALGYFQLIPPLSFSDTLIEQQIIFTERKSTTDFFGNEISDDEITMGQ
jgi:hypothetical protein